MAKKNDAPHNVKCSFCGKPQEAVSRIVAGPGVYICDECVAVCKSIIENDTYNEDEFEYCHIVLPVNGDVDCMTFDKADKRFRKITNVMSVGQASAEEVPAYTFVSPKTLAETSYVKEEDESVKDGLYTESIRRFISSHQWDGLSDA